MSKKSKLTPDRKPRQTIDKSKHDLLEPLDIYSLGSKKDPCFGYYDLKAEECNRCGDSEFCSIATAQNLSKERKKISKTQRFKDEEEAEFKVKQKGVKERRAQKYLKSIKGKKPYLKCIKAAQEKYPEIDKSKLKEIYKAI